MQVDLESSGAFDKVIMKEILGDKQFYISEFYVDPEKPWQRISQKRDSCMSLIGWEDIKYFCEYAVIKEFSKRSSKIRISFELKAEEPHGYTEWFRTMPISAEEYTSILRNVIILLYPLIEEHHTWMYPSDLDFTRELVEYFEWTNVHILH